MFGILSVNLLDASVCQFSYSGLQCVNSQLLDTLSIHFW